jgi:hypothetical protein
MPATPAPEQTAPDYARALFGVYLRASLWYVGLVTALWMLGLEAVHGHPTPFYALFSPVFATTDGLWALPGAAAAAALLFGFVRWLAPSVLAACVGRDHPAGTLSRKYLALLVAFSALFPAAVATMRGGLDGLSDAYARQSYEYIGDIGSGGSIRGLFHDYEKIHPYLSMHAKVHPPGPIAILWLLSYLAGRTPMGLSIATILFGALSVVPMYFLAKDVLGARQGLVATLLYTLMPSIVLFTATSADMTFMPFTLTTLFLFWRAIHHGHREERSDKVISSAGEPRLARTLALPLVRELAYAAGAGLLYGILGLISYSLLGIGAFFALVGLWRLFDPRTRWSVVRTAVVMAIGVAAVHGLVYLWSGYNSVSAFALARTQFATDQANLDLMDPRWPAWTFRVLNPLSWLFFAGIPVSVLALRRCQAAFSREGRLFLVIGLTLLAFDILYLARGEGERSAMYVMPFLVLPAAHLLDEISAAARSWRPLTLTLACLGVQCIAIEAILYTYW